MKHTISLAMLLLFSVTTLFAQHNKMGDKPKASPHETVTGKHIKISYGRPYKKGRDIFGGLVPYDQVWRTGADEATEITIDKDCTFAGKALKAGTYSLFTIPGKDGEWTIILNSELKQWGAFGYDKIKDKNVLEAKVPAKHIDKTAEQFTIAVADGGITMEWDQTSVMIPVKF